MLENLTVLKNEKALTRKQETFVAAMLTLPTIDAAARAAGVTGKTAHTWLKDTRIQAALEQAREQAFNHALQKLQDVTEESIDMLCSIMRDKEASLGMRIRAAAVLLEKSLEIHIVRELTVELAEIKRLSSPAGRKFG